MNATVIETQMPAGAAGPADPLWHGVGGASRRRWWRHFSWRELLWGLLLPKRAQRILPTWSGLVLLVLILAIGLAA